jgi:hypothetical protein
VSCFDRLLPFVLLAACGSPPQTCSTCADAGQRVTDAGSPPVDAGVTSGLVVNELASLDDFIELFNRGTQPVDLSGHLVAHRAPDGGVQRADAVALSGSLGADQYLVLSGVADAGAMSFTFNLSNGSGDTVFLLGSDGGVVDEVTFPPDSHNAGESWGRRPNGTGAFQKLTTRSPGTVNP